jgi:hypothetical protein
VPNGVRSTPFYNLDKTHDGDGWSRHKMSMLTANPLFLASAKYRRNMSKMFGGKHSPDYITQVLGEWGDEAMSSFPSGSVSFDSFMYGRKVHPYYPVRLSGLEVGNAIREARLPALIRIPSVHCLRVVIGWDYGFSPDPTTFIAAIQTDEGGPWKTYCRVSLYNTPLHHQIDVLRFLMSSVFSNRVVMISTDNQIAFNEMMRDELQYIFKDVIKLSNPGGTIEYDSVDGVALTEENKNRPEVILHRNEGKVIREWVKYWLTETLRRYMMNAILQKSDDIRFELGYDAELESEFLSTVERKTKSHTIYEVPKDSRKVNMDQLVDALRYCTDAIMYVESMRTKPAGANMDELIAVMGWAGSKKGDWKAPWDAKER